MESPFPSARILVIEDELHMRAALERCLAAEGYRVLTAADGESGLECALREKPNLILLDIMMPRLDGFALCAELRRLSVEMPVLMLTAKGQVEDRVRGLNAGADDYLGKPFSTDELLARIRSLLRRTQRAGLAPAQIRLGEVRIDFVMQKAWKSERPLALSQREFGILRLLAEFPGQPVSRERFLDVVWGYGAFPTTRTVDSHIAKLRVKIEPAPDRPRYLQTVHGVGYRLEGLVPAGGPDTQSAASDSRT